MSDREEPAQCCECWPDNCAAAGRECVGPERQDAPARADDHTAISGGKHVRQWQRDVKPGADAHANVASRGRDYADDFGEYPGILQRCGCRCRFGPTGPFDLSPSVCTRAISMLAKRSREEYIAVLLAGFRHAWPPAATHAAEALISLNDQKAIPALEELLTEPGPSGLLTVNGNPKSMVRELVRVNHLKNCLLCHAPAINVREPVVGRSANPGPTVAFGSGVLRVRNLPGRHPCPCRHHLLAARFLGHAAGQGRQTVAGNAALRLPACAPGRRLPRNWWPTGEKDSFAAARGDPPPWKYSGWIPHGRIRAVTVTSYLPLRDRLPNSHVHIHASLRVAPFWPPSGVAAIAAACLADQLSNWLAISSRSIAALRRPGSRDPKDRRDRWPAHLPTH